MAAVEAQTSFVQKKVGVIGSGAIGLYFGARLLEAGHEVSFLCRRDAAALSEKGLSVSSVKGDMHFPPKSLRIFTSSDDIGNVDWVLLALKSYALEDAEKLVRPLLSPTTRILAIMNGIGIEEVLSSKFPSNPILGGMAFACINRGDPGFVIHSAYGILQIGHFGDDQAILEEVQALFSGSKVEVNLCPSYLVARWDKLCWNLPFNGVAVAMGGVTVDVIARDPDLRAQAVDVMKEVVAVANADLRHHGVAQQLDEAAVVERMFGFTDKLGPYRTSTMVDLCEKRQLEIEFLFLVPLQRAAALNVPCPALTSVVRFIRGHDRLRGALPP